MEIEIRKAKESDEPVILEIAYAAWLSAYSHILGKDAIVQKFENRKKDRAYHEEQLKEINETDKHFVATKNGTVLGFVSVSDESDFFEITRLYVNPTEQRGGIGKKLFDKAIEIAKSKNFKTMRIEALKQNNIGCSFYKKHGGEIISTKTKFLCGVEAELVTFEYNL